MSILSPWHRTTPPVEVVEAAPTTTIGLLCCCGAHVEIRTTQLIDAQTERAAWDARHARCLPVVSDTELERQGRA